MSLISAATKNIRRSPYQGMMAMVMMSLVFFFSYVLLMVVLGSQIILLYFESRPQVIAFFSTATPIEKVQTAAETMKTKAYVQKVHIVTKEDALNLYKADNQKDPVLLELVSADIFPASLEVSAKEITSLSKIRDDLQSLDGVSDVVYQKNVIDSLSTIIRNVRVIGVAVIGFLLVMSGMFIVVLLSLRVAMKRQEIGIMRLLGAGAGYILGPFMMEGIIYGSVGAVVGWLGMFTLLQYLTPVIVTFLGTIIHLPVPPVFLAGLLAGGIVVGALVGIVSSMIAVKRFIRH